MQKRFRDVLEEEFTRRRQANPRSSLRAFAAFLGADHSTLSQVLRRERRLPLRSLRSWARKLALDPEQVAVYIAAEHLPEPHGLVREDQLRQWTAEATAVMTDGLHWKIYRMCQPRGLEVDCRRVAEQIAGTVDEVNVAFARMLRLGILKTDAKGRWINALGERIPSRQVFDRIALERVRAMAAAPAARRRAGSSESKPGTKPNKID